MLLKPITWLEDDEIIKVHKNALALIESVGFKLDNIDLLKKLKSRDAIIDLSSKQAKIPKKMSEYYLSTIPQKITLCAVDQKYDLEFGKKRYYRSISGTIGIIEKVNKSSTGITLVELF